MKNTNKLVALILTVLMLVGSTVAYADTYASDPVSPNISISTMEEQPEAEPTSTPEASEQIAPTEATVEVQPETEATPAPEAGEVTTTEEPVKEQLEPEATPAPEAGEVAAPAEENEVEQPTQEAPETEAAVTTESENDTVDIHAAASTDAEIIGQLSSNDRVVMLGVEGDWTKIRANGVVGYVFSKNLQVSAPEAMLTPEESTPSPFESQYRRNDLGELVLDDQGNPIPLTPAEGEVQYQKDGDGNLILDENGEPIFVVAQTPAQEANRSDLSLAVINTWMDAGDETKYGDTVAIHYGIQNFYGWTYTVQWQQKGADGWSDVPGATGETYSFTLTEENLHTEWRVRVDVAVPETSEGAAS
jgi:hypothetical protein